MKKALAVLMAGLVMSGVAKATPTTEDLEIKDHGILVEVVSQLGVNVQFQPAACTKADLYGFYMLDGSLLALCSKGDEAERMDTIRHEAWHVYQDMKDCSIKDSSNLTAALSTGATPKYYKDHAAKYYDQHQVGYEAEAIWAANTFSAMTIANMIHQKGIECGYKFQF